MSTEFFTRALQLAHSFDPSVTSQERLNAEKYLMELEGSPEGLNIVFHIINNEPAQEVRCFWAFNTVIHQLPSLSQSVSVEQAEELYSTLFMFIYRYFFTPVTAPADFLINKHAQMMAVGLQNFYPSRWGSFFKNLFDLLARGQTHPQFADAVTMYFLRVCEYIDERVVSTRDRVDRGKDQRTRDMEIKDAMRGAVVMQLVDSWYRILSESRHRVPELAKICLDVVQTYIEWIDIALVTTADWINLLYYLITVPPLRVAACECVLSLVEKKQLTGTKMNNLRMLNVVDSLPRLVSMLTVPPSNESDVAFIVIVCRLTAAVAEQFLSLLESCSAMAAAAGDQGVQGYPNCASRSSESPTRVVVGVDGVIVQDVNFEVTQQLLDSLSGALHAVVSQLLRLFQINLFEAREVLLPFVQSFVKSAAMTDTEMEQLLCALFGGSIAKPVPYQEEDIWDGDVVGQQRTLHNLTRLLYRRNANLVMNHLSSLVQGVVDGRRGGIVGDSLSYKSTTPSSADIDFTQPEVVEAVLLYFFEIGAALKLETCLRDPKDASTYLLAQLLTSDNVVIHHTNASVQQMFFEVMDRYHLFFMHHPQYLPVLLQRLLLLPCGVSNPEERVRGRICYLFVHLLQVLRPSLAGYAGHILRALQSILAGAAPRGGLLRPGDRRDLWEAVGGLLPLALPPGAQEGATTTTTTTTTTPSSSSTTTTTRPSQNGQQGGEEGDEDGEEHNGAGGGAWPLATGLVQEALEGLWAAGEADRARTTSAAAVADALSYLTAIAKGLAGGGGNNSNNNSAGGTPASPGTAAAKERDRDGGERGFDPSPSRGATGAAMLFAQLFPPVLEHVQFLYVASPWRGAAVVREAIAQFLQQMINLLPGEHLLGFWENYVACSLDTMETVQELSKLLRLLEQFVNRIGATGTASVARITPMVWNKIMSAGVLTTASPMVNMGVISENARETIDVYRNFFHFLFSIGTWGCAPAVLLLPHPYLDSILTQMSHAITLPAEVELPKFSLQALTRLTQELLNSTGVEGLPLDGGATTTFTENRLYLRAFLLEQVLPTTLQTLLSPVFNLNDAKNFVLIGEAGQFLKSLCSANQHGKGGSDGASISGQFGEEGTALADAALQAIYRELKTPCQGGNIQNGYSSAEHSTGDPILAFCVSLREKPRFNLALKNQLRSLLEAVQQKAG